MSLILTSGKRKSEALGLRLDYEAYGLGLGFGNESQILGLGFGF